MTLSKNAVKNLAKEKAKTLGIYYEKAMNMPIMELEDLLEKKKGQENV